MILVSTQSPQSLDIVHANDGVIEVHHAGEMITCLLRLHDDFADFSLIARFRSMISLIIKLRKERIRALIYIIKKNTKT